MPLLKGDLENLESQDLYAKVLVSCCNGNSGLFLLDFKIKEYVKIFDGNCRGMVHSDGRLFLAFNDRIVRVNQDFNIVKDQLIAKDIHGVEMINKDTLLIAETAINAIGCYDANTLQRLGEIRLNPSSEHINHVNDLWVDGRDLYISMFTPSEKWVIQPTGCIIKVDVTGFDRNKELSLDPTQYCIVQELNMPHSVKMHEGQLLYNDSMSYETVIGERRVKFQGFTRGIEWINNYLIVGISQIRHMDAGVCGIDIHHLKQNTSEFIPLPADEVYSILHYG